MTPHLVRHRSIPLQDMHSGVPWGSPSPGGHLPDLRDTYFDSTPGCWKCWLGWTGQPSGCRPVTRPPLFSQARFFYTEYPLNQSAGISFEYNQFLDVIIKPHQRGFLILWSQTNLLVSPNSGEPGPVGLLQRG